MRHEGTRAGFESATHKGREITTRLGVLPAGVPNKRVSARGTIASPIIHDMPAHLHEARAWAVEYLAGPNFWMPAKGRGMRGNGEAPEGARRLGHSPGYRLLVRNAAGELEVELPPKPVTGNPDTDKVTASVRGDVAVMGKRAKMMMPRG